MDRQWENCQGIIFKSIKGLFTRVLLGKYELYWRWFWRYHGPGQRPHDTFNLHQHTWSFVFWVGDLIRHRLLPYPY